MKKIIFFYPHINSIGGVEMAILRLAKQLNKDYNIHVGFTKEDSDFKLLSRINEYATIVNLNYINESYDVAVYCSLWLPKQVKAKKYIRWVHGCVNDMNYKMKPEPTINKYVAVGATCANQITSQLPKIKPEIIFNELDWDIHKKATAHDIERKTLTLTTVSRISPEKGFERMLKISEQLALAKIDYVWHIVGNGYNKSYQNLIHSKAPKQWVFHGSQDNPFPYMKNADFLVQLSDYEAFGYVMLEALVLGTPVITTNYQSAYEMVTPNVNGEILQKDLSDFSLEIFNKKYIFTFDYKTSADKWRKILG